MDSRALYATSQCRLDALGRFEHCSPPKSSFFFSLLNDSPLRNTRLGWDMRWEYAQSEIQKCLTSQPVLTLLALVLLPQLFRYWDSFQWWRWYHWREANRGHRWGQRRQPGKTANTRNWSRCWSPLAWQHTNKISHEYKSSPYQHYQTILRLHLIIINDRHMSTCSYDPYSSSPLTSPASSLSPYTATEQRFLERQPALRWRR